MVGLVVLEGLQSEILFFAQQWNTVSTKVIALEGGQFGINRPEGIL